MMPNVNHKFRFEYAKDEYCTIACYLSDIVQSGFYRRLQYGNGGLSHGHRYARIIG